MIVRGDDTADPLSAAKLVASRLLTETRRSETQIRLQHFSTPLPIAGLVARTAGIRTGETVLEPSAGTGALMAFAACSNAGIILNEIDPFRQRLLRLVFDSDVTSHDGEHIDDLLQTPVLPDVVIMNPPFASTADRSNDKHVAAKHLIAAAKRLAPGGRLAAIMPPGFCPERDAAHWARATGIVAPRLALTLPGNVYAKLGTRVETQIMVFDKTAAHGEMTRASVQSLDEALPYIDDVAATRPAPRNTHTRETITLAGASTLPQHPAHGSTLWKASSPN